MKREIAIVLAPLAGGFLTVLAGYLINGLHPKDTSDISFAVIALGFPVALLLSLLSGLFIQPQLVKHNIFTVPVVGIISGLLALFILAITGLPFIFLIAGTLWGATSGVFYRVFVGQPKL